MKGCGEFVRASAIISALIVVFCLSALKSASADERSAPAAQVEADVQISSLLTGIESAITQNHALPRDAGHMLISAGDLWSSASPEGRRQLKNFPAQLRKSADEVRDPEARKYLTVFADAVTGYIETITSVVTDHSPAPEPSPPPVKEEKKAVTPPPHDTGPVAPAREPSPPPVKQETKAATPPAPDPSRLPFPVQRTLLDRGDAMLGLGDVAAARLLYQRAADEGVGVAALKLAQTYDPAFLTARNLRGIRPDPTAAEAWYRKAATLGEAPAAERLKSLTGHRVAGETTTR